ncbi:MAG: TIGR02996 domain-containing protein [Kofleriaceae bacterium]
MEEQLLQAIRERPEDDEPRLVYADWLTDRGDPRGELVVVQCHLARLPYDDEARRDLDVRLRALMAEHGESWRRALAAIPTVDNAYFKRGFVERISMEESLFAEHAPAIFEAAPLLTDVHLVSRTHPGPPVLAPELARLDGLHIATTMYASAALASPLVRSLVRLELDRECGPRVLDAMLPHAFPRLEKLELTQTNIGTQGLDQLVASGLLANLRRLHIGFCKIESAFSLARSPDAAKLRTLWINENPLGARGATELLTSANLAGLEEIDLGDTQAGDALARAALPNLRTVRYRNNRLTAEAGRALAENPGLPALERLELTGPNDAPTCELEAAVAIVSAKALPKLTALRLDQQRFGIGSAPLFHAIRPGFLELDLAWNSPSLDEIAALADNPNVATIEKLVLASNGFGERGIRRLAKSPYLRPHSLDLRFVPLGDGGMASLVASGFLSEVRTLELQGCGIGDRGVRALARSRQVPHLFRLSLFGNAVTDEGALALAASKHVRPLSTLSLTSTQVTERGAAALRAAGHDVRI